MRKFEWEPVILTIALFWMLCIATYVAINIGDDSRDAKISCEATITPAPQGH